MLCINVPVRINAQNRICYNHSINAQYEQSKAPSHEFQAEEGAFMNTDKPYLVVSTMTKYIPGDIFESFLENN